MGVVANKEINSIAYLINIEKSVLSSMFFEYETIEVLVEKLNHEMFYFPAHKEAFRVCAELYKESMPVDEEFVKTRCNKDVLSDNFLLDILSANPISNVEAYANEILEAHTKREIESLSLMIKKAIHEDSKNSSEIMDLINEKVNSIENFDIKANDIKTLGQWNDEFNKEPDLKILPTGISWIDHALDGGVKVGNFFFLSGKKETGKTYLATTIMENMAMNSIKCGFFSMEFGTKHYRDSINKKYPHKDNQKKLAIFQNVYVEHRVNDIGDIEKKIKKMVKKGVEFVFIDSQLRVTNASKTNATKAEILADSFSRIGLMAQKHEIVIMMVVQTSKSDHDADEVSVKGCIDADHEASLWLHIKKQKDGELRDMVFAKNKQNFMRPKVTVKFNPFTHEFKKINFETKEGIPVEDLRDDEPEETEFVSSHEMEVHSTDKTFSKCDVETINNLL